MLNGDVNMIQANNSTFLSFADFLSHDILRAVSPHIRGNQWRLVGRSLGLSDQDLQLIHKANPMSRASELAFRVLDTWWKRQEEADPKERLLKVLAEHQLNAAAGKQYVVFVDSGILY